MEKAINKTWWKEGVVYQIYPRSFKDGNSDGMGDLKGIIQKLDYLKELGIDILWLCPIYQSPNDDNGYDVSDYRAISSEFGTMEDFDELLSGLHQRGIKLVMDLVVNHSSDEHHWFKEARKSKDNPYRDYYIWKKGKDGGPPNNWVSFFGGPAWEYEETTDEYYLHLFSRKQPDLNWENEQLREEVYAMMHFWLKKGVDGFRMDVIPFISKYQDFPEIDPYDFFNTVNTVYANGPRIHEFLQEMNEKVLSKYDVMTVGEATGVSPEQGLLYVGEDRKELNMIFHFGHMFMHSGSKGRFDTRETSLNEFKEVFSTWDNAIDDRGWVSIFLGNHDFARAVSRFGDDKEYRVESAKVIATLLMTLRGTPYIYQGDEIGMKNLNFKDYSEIRDLESVFFYNESLKNGLNPEEILDLINIHARDHARSPLQWDSSLYSGFSTSQPWIMVNDDFEQVNIEHALNDPNSILKYYQSMIQIRKNNEALVYGSFTPKDDGHPAIFVYDRTWKGEHFRVYLNFTSEMVRIPEELVIQGTKIIDNYSEDRMISGQLNPWEAKVIQIS